MRSVAVNPRVAVQSAHSTGKSHLASRLVAWFLSVHPPEDTFVVTTAPTASQVRAILWRYIAQVHSKAGLDGRVTQAAEWKIDDQLVAYGRKPSDYVESNFSGIHAKHLLVVLDEACGVSKHLWVSADSLATGADSHQLAIGNPDDKASHFAHVCQVERGWVKHKISAFDTPNCTGEEVPELLRQTLVSEEWIEDKKLRWGENSPLYQAKVLGEFADSEDGLIPLSWVTAAHQRWHEWNENPLRDSHQPPGRTVLGVDVARFGEDKTAIATRKGDVVMSVESFAKLDTTQTAGLVEARLNGPVQPLAVVDVVGVGAGVVDMLRRSDCGVVAFNGAERTKRRDSSGAWKFPNVRCAAWYNLREMLDPALGATLALPPDDDLTADLTAPKYEPRAGAQLWVEDKTSLKARLGHSPDLGDAVTMSLWADTLPRADDNVVLRPLDYDDANAWQDY